MSLVTILPGRRSTGPAVPSSSPTPRALIDYDFQNVLMAPPKQRFVLWLMAGLVAFAAAALAILKVDVVVSANGKIVTGDSEIVIQPVEMSVVRSVAVKMGQQVKAGEVLATLDPTFTKADRDELGAKLRTLEATFNRLDAELAGRVYDPRDPDPEAQTQRDVFRKRRDEYAAKLSAAEHKVEQSKADLAAHKAEAKSLQEQIRLASEAENIYQQLVAKELASKLKLLDASQRLVDTQSRLETNLGEQEKLTEQIAGAQADRDGFVQEWQRKLSEDLAQTRSDRDAAAARLSKAQLRHELAVMTAPEDATVLEVAPRPPGSVLKEAETLMRLVPTSAPLLVEAQVDTRDVARLHLGNRATIKLEALPWQQFGLAYAELNALTPDTLSDDNARETGEEGSSPELKTQAKQSPIHFRARFELRENPVPQPAGRVCAAARHAGRRRRQGRAPRHPRLCAEPDHPGDQRKPARTVIALLPFPPPLAGDPSAHKIRMNLAGIWVDVNCRNTTNIAFSPQNRSNYRARYQVISVA